MSHNLGQLQGVQKAIGTQGPFLSWGSRMASLYKVINDGVELEFTARYAEKELCLLIYFIAILKRQGLSRW